MKGSGGIAKGLYFKLNPRFERDFLGGDAASDRIWLKNLPAGAVFYDFGSHIGVFAVSGARLVGSEGMVYALEPDPGNACLIRENAQRNHLRVEVIEAAAWKESGTLSFFRSDETSDPGRMGGHIAETSGPTGVISVEAVSLDDFAKEHRPPSFIKLDVEGAEAEVLEGGRATLLRYKPNLLIEIHNDQAFHRVSALLEEFGYGFECVAERQYLACPKISNGTSTAENRHGRRLMP